MDRALNEGKVGKVFSLFKRLTLKKAAIKALVYNYLGSGIYYHIFVRSGLKSGMLYRISVANGRGTVVFGR